MKVYTEQTVVTQVLTDVRCNKCGRTVMRDDFGYMYDYASFQKRWGYLSPMDGESHSFDVCVDCYLEWIRQFQIPPQVGQLEEDNGERTGCPAESD